MTKLTREFFRTADACYTDAQIAAVIPPKGLTALQVCDLAIPAVDRIWALTREGGVPERIQRLFAVRCARRALASVPDPDARSVHAVDVAERFANGEATSEELAEARDAADAADAAADAAYRAAYRAAEASADAARAACAAASAAARAARAACAAYAACAADWVAYWAAEREAAHRAAEREAQVRDFRELLA